MKIPRTESQTHPKCPKCNVLINNWRDHFPVRVLDLTREHWCQVKCPGCRTALYVTTKVVREWKTEVVLEALAASEDEREKKE